MRSEPIGAERKNCIATAVVNPFDPQQNVDAGVRHLKRLMESYGGDVRLTLAAYNAGAGAVARSAGVPHYRETRNYVQKVTSSYNRPGSNRLAHALDIQHPIYRAVNSGGQVVFTNE